MTRCTHLLVGKILYRSPVGQRSHGFAPRHFFRDWNLVVTFEATPVDDVRAMIEFSPEKHPLIDLNGEDARIRDHVTHSAWLCHPDGEILQRGALCGRDIRVFH